MPPFQLGEFEHLVLLAVLQARDQGAYAVQIRHDLEQRTGRSVSRGALYRTFDRLKSKGLLDWQLEDGGRTPDRGGHPMRRFRVTTSGMKHLRASRAVLLRCWENLEHELDRV
jgi:DNA-binding PadR family transcriptional regulator